MRKMLKNLVYCRCGGLNQSGLSMAEVMIGTAVGVLITVGTLVLLTYMVTVADENRDKTMATLEVQYVGFWISEDVVQAQSIQLGESEQDPDGFPLIINWITWDGSVEETITYELEQMEGSQMMQMIREREVYRDGSEDPDPVHSGTSLIAQYLMPWSESEGTGTRCCRMVYSTDYDEMKSLVLNVAAKADRSEASTYYEIYPRTVVNWLPEDVDGYYNGPECPAS